MTPQTGRPSRPERVLYGSLLGLAVLGLLAPTAYQFNLAPAGSILELAFFVSAVLLARRVVPGARTMLVLSALYVFLKTLLLLIYGSASIPDFLQGYKTYFYLVLLSFFVGKQVFSGQRLARFATVLVAAFFVKYAYSVVLGFSDRPGIFIENNFELIMLIGLVYLAYPYLGNRRALVFGVLAVTVLLSGSRSSALGLLVVYVFLYVRLRNRTWPLHVAGVVAVGYAVFTLFTSRLDGQSVEAIDRVQFLEVFLREVRTWPVWEFVTGAFPLTPLSPAGCARLSFYQPLFSATDPGVCYSVILHSYVLRAVFDHGLLGIALLYTLVWLALRRSAVTRRDALALLSVITLSGFSVSAFNNVFTTIVLAVAMGLDRSAAPPEPPAAGPPGRVRRLLTRSRAAGTGGAGPSSRARQVRRRVAGAAAP